MAELKTDYKDQLLDSLVNTKRVYNLVDADGNVVRENVSLEDVTVYSQDGDNFGAADINKTNEEVNQLNRYLINENGETFRYGYQDGKRGVWIREAGTDVFIPFKNGAEKYNVFFSANGLGATGGTSPQIKAYLKDYTNNYVDLTVDNIIVDYFSSDVKLFGLPTGAFATPSISYDASTSLITLNIGSTTNGFYNSSATFDVYIIRE